MMKLTIIILLVGYAVASGLVSSQRATIHHAPHHGHGVGVSTRYFDKAEHGLGHGLYGLGYGRGYYGAGHLGPYGYGYLGGHEAGHRGPYGYGYLGGHEAGHRGPYGYGYLGGHGAGYLRGYGGNAYDGIDNLGLAYNNYDFADGRLGHGYGYGLGSLGFRYL